MGKVPRHEFVPERSRLQAYDDHPLPIGDGQTISQPFVVAFMTQELVLLRKHGGKLEQHAVLPVQFVPMTGKAEGKVEAPVAK